MKLLVKEVLYKILIISMITIVLSFFCVSSVCEAKLKLKDGQFYYSGTQESTLIVEASFWSKILGVLAEIANYILGIQTFAYRGVVVGWIEIMEILLTAILGVQADLGSFFVDALAGSDAYAKQIVNVEKIIFNRVKILDANVLKPLEIPDGEEATDMDKVVDLIKNSVAKWYYILRLISIAFMLVLLIFIGVKMALSTIASEKAVYKQMLIDWIVGMILVFSIHYIMIFILNINDSIVAALEPLAKDKTASGMVLEYQYGEEDELPTSSEIETSLYETVRTRAYSLKMTDGFTGLIIYGVLVYYAWRFALIYFRRVINIIILTLTAPVIAASYALNKVVTGKSKIYSTWFSEYMMNVITQIVHVIMYVSFVSIALQLATQSLSGIVLAFVLLSFMTKSEKLIREIFKISGGGKGSLAGDMNDRTGFNELKSEALGMKDAMIGGAVTKTAMKATYGIATKPARQLGLYGAAKITAGVLNSEGYKQRQEDKQNEEIINAQKHLENSENGQKILALEQRKKNLLEKYHPNLTQDQIDELKAEGIMPGDAEYYNALCNYGINIEKEQKQIDKDIKALQTKYEEEYLKKKLESGASIKDTVKENLGVAFRGLVKFDKRTGKYKVRDIKSEVRRVGGNNKAFWRKKEDSLGLRFKESMKMKNLLGLDDAEVKILKGRMDFWKNRIVGLGSAIVGMPMLAINPLVGMAMLTKTASSQIEVSKRRRRARRAKYNEKYNSYRFVGFGPGAMQKLSRAELYHILESEKAAVLEHKKVNKELKRLMEYSKYLDSKEIQIKNKVDDLKKQLDDEYREHEEKIREEVEQKTNEELLIEEALREKKAVNLGEKVCMQLKNNSEMNKVLEAIKQVNATADFSEQSKISRIQQIINENKQTVISSAIMNLCDQQGITDITKVQLTDMDMLQINSNILHTIENVGVPINRDNFLEKSQIGEKSISEVYLDLALDYETTNKVLEDRLAASIVLEYMQNSGIKDFKELNTENAKEKMYDMVKEKFMPDSSKQSSNVIAQILGKDKLTEEFEVPETIINNIEEKTKEVKEIDIKEEAKKLDDNARQKLIDREVNRRLNETKRLLEQALYEDVINDVTYNNDDEKQSIENTLDEEQLSMLFTLKDLNKQNKLADKYGIRIDENSGKRKEEFRTLYFGENEDTNSNDDSYYNSSDVIKALHVGHTLKDGVWQPDNTKDGSRKFNSINDGSLKIGQTNKNKDLKERRELREINTKIHGKAVDITDLINNIGKR